MSGVMVVISARSRLRMSTRAQTLRIVRSKVSAPLQTIYETLRRPLGVLVSNHLWVIPGNRSGAEYSG
jgi:hypothetical protein